LSSLPEYNENGTLPEGVYRPPLREFKARYVDGFASSLTRKTIFEGFLRLSSVQISEEFHLSQWVNGSYITKKVDPKDLDLVTFVDGLKARVKNDPEYLKRMTKDILKRFLCHSYVVPIYPESDDRFSFTRRSEEYWNKWFGHDRQGHPKGFIEFNLRDNAHLATIALEVKDL